MEKPKIYRVVNTHCNRKTLVLMTKLRQKEILSLNTGEPQTILWSYTKYIVTIIYNTAIKSGRLISGLASRDIE